MALLMAHLLIALVLLLLGLGAMRNPRTTHFHTPTYLSLGLEPKETVLVTFLIAETKYQQEAAKGGNVHSTLIQERVQSVMVGKSR